MTFTKRTYLLLLLLVAAWCVGFFLAPMLSTTAPGVSAGLYACYEPICHQLDGRSFHVEEGKFAVCARCTSIYLGFFLALIAYPFLRRLDETSVPSRMWILLAVVPMGVDVALSFLGIHSSTFVTRAVSGGLFGFIMPWFVVPVFIEAVSQLRDQFSSRGGLFYARKAQ
jgi:uncharacterized membrane protein